MGGASSSVSQKYDTTVISNNDINILSEQINDYTANTIMKNASSCSGSLTQMQDIDWSGTSVAGDFNFTADQNQTGAINFDCIQTANMTSDVANEVLNKMLQTLHTSYDKNIIDQLDASASTKSKSGVGSFDTSKTSSDVSIDYKYTDIQNTSKNITNVVKNAITNNLDLTNIQDCITNTKQIQQASFKNLNVGGNVVAAVKQSQAADMVAKCVQNSNFSNKIVNQVVSDLGLQQSDQSSLTKSTSISAEAKSERIAEGYLDGWANIASAVVGPLAGLFGLGSMAWCGMILCCICCCILCCIMSSAGAALVASKSGGAGGFDTKMVGQNMSKYGDKMGSFGRKLSQVGGLFDYVTPDKVTNFIAKLY
uniref:Uncharacterized protein n=1 Tax=viral metagenome TaxID=1070528 RepID=A0A6C0EAH0_9ZZZZ